MRTSVLLLALVTCVPSQGDQAITELIEFVEVVDPLIVDSYKSAQETCLRIHPEATEPAERKKCVDSVRAYYKQYFEKSEKVRKLWCSITPDDPACKCTEKPDLPECVEKK